VTEQPAPDLDTAIVLGMASTAIPFAGTREAEAERWLRILRLHGQAGAALQSLGVSEAPLEAHGDTEPVPSQQEQAEDVVARVGEGASAVAERRGARTVETSDVLVAVMDVYGSDFDEVLRVHGTDRKEVLIQLELKAA
jgi:hypothetical protein